MRIGSTIALVTLPFIASACANGGGSSTLTPTPLPPTYAAYAATVNKGKPADFTVSVSAKNVAYIEVDPAENQDPTKVGAEINAAVTQAAPQTACAGIANIGIAAPPVAPAAALTPADYGLIVTASAIAPGSCTFAISAGGGKSVNVFIRVTS